MRKGLLLAAMLATPVSVHSAAGTDGAAFLNIPLGGAPSAMGSAYSALATDVYAPSLNPGGLGYVKSVQAAGHHIDYLDSAHYEYLSLVVPVRSYGAVGLAAQYFGTGDIASVDELGNGLGEFSSRYGAYTLSYGLPLFEKLSLGFSGRWINAKIADVSADAFAADAGLLGRWSSRVQSSLVVSNLGTKLKFIEQKDSLPLAVKLGTAYRSPLRWTITAEGVYEKTGKASARFGGQWQPVPLLALRAGYRTDTAKELSALSGFSTGLGLTAWGSEFTYTWMPYGDLGDTHAFGMVIKFGDKESGPTALSHAGQVAMPDLEYEYLKMLLAATDGPRELRP